MDGCHNVMHVMHMQKMHNTSTNECRSDGMIIERKYTWTTDRFELFVQAVSQRLHYSTDLNMFIRAKYLERAGEHSQNHI
mmetsp:Transcript_151883/g.279373  ORF Transcript_151883/g.279373 Transcript_151883/m.279373 type:complete len:80 (-) Transcript_151883:145-384(-)